MRLFTIAQNRVRVAIYPLKGDSGFSYASQLLNSIASQDQLFNALDTLATDYYDGSSGQPLIEFIL